MPSQCPLENAFGALLHNPSLTINLTPSLLTLWRGKNAARALPHTPQPSRPEGEVRTCGQPWVRCSKIWIRRFTCVTHSFPRSYIIPCTHYFNDVALIVLRCCLMFCQTCLPMVQKITRQSPSLAETRCRLFILHYKYTIPGRTVEWTSEHDCYLEVIIIAVSSVLVNSMTLET